MRQSHTSAVELGTTWEGEYATEPHECSWAREALLFIRLLEGDVPAGASARVQISPDGIRWCDEGTDLRLPGSPDELTFARLREFGGWLRLSGSLPPGARLTVIVYAVLKE